jgi:hypothetical protein
MMWNRKKRRNMRTATAWRCSHKPERKNVTAGRSLASKPKISRRRRQETSQAESDPLVFRLVDFVLANFISPLLLQASKLTRHLRLQRET